MNRLFTFFALILLASCGGPQQTKVPCYAWLGGPGKSTDQQIKEQFTDFKSKGIDGLMYNGGQDPATYERVGALAKEAGLEFYAWIPTMVQQPNEKLKPEYYGINGLGESAYDKPVYTSYYRFLCPNKVEVCDYLEQLYAGVADVKSVDGIHLDYIRYPDVILARGLWEKYNLVMDKEYPKYDYCYCDKCVADFKAKTGIDIKKVKDPSQVQEWKQFRYDLITNLVNRLSKMVHAKGKKINAAVFPGPDSHAKKMVRQEWNKWDVDALYPMNYNDFYLEDTKWIGAMTKEETTSVDGKRPIFSGLFICPKPDRKSQEKDPENHGLLPEEMEAAIAESMANGAKGICLFTPSRMTDAHWAAFDRAIHKKYEIKK